MSDNVSIIHQVLNNPTVTVRVALAVAADGSWSAYGYNGGDDKNVMELARDGLEPEVFGENHFWLELEVPVPVARTLTPRLVEG